MVIMIVVIIIIDSHRRFSSPSLPPPILAIFLKTKKIKEPKNEKKAPSRGQG